MKSNSTGLYDPASEKSSCGVGFITRKDSVQSHDILIKAHEALCSVPHRGGMSSEGVGDGADIFVLVIFLCQAIKTIVNMPRI